MTELFPLNNSDKSMNVAETIKNNNKKEHRSRSSAFSENLNLNNEPHKERVVDNFFRIVNAFINNPEIIRHVLTRFPTVIDRIPGKSNTNVLSGFQTSMNANSNLNSKTYSYTKYILKKLLKAVQDNGIDFMNISMDEFFEEAFGLNVEQVERRLNELHPVEPVILRNGTRSEAYIQNPGRFFSYLKYYHLFDEDFLEWIRTTDELSDLVSILVKEKPITGNFALLSTAQFGNKIPPESELRLFADEYILFKEEVRPPFIQRTTNFPIIDLRVFVGKLMNTSALSKLFMSGAILRISSGVLRILNASSEYRRLLEKTIGTTRLAPARSTVTAVRIPRNTTVRVARKRKTVRRQRRNRFYRTLA